MQMCDAGDDQVIIRKANPADFEASKVLWDGYNAFTGGLETLRYRTKSHIQLGCAFLMPTSQCMHLLPNEQTD